MAPLRIDAGLIDLRLLMPDEIGEIVRAYRPDSGQSFIRPTEVRDESRLARMFVDGGWREPGFFGIRYRGRHRILGCCGLWGTPGGLRELICAVRPEDRGHGVGSAAAAAVLQWAFDSLEPDHVHARWTHGVEGLRLLTRLGFYRVGGPGRDGGEWHFVATRCAEPAASGQDVESCNYRSVG